MGYELNRFVDKISEDLLCSICSKVLKEPVQSPSEFLFCSDCIKQWLAADGICLLDYGPLGIDDFKPAPKFMCNLLDRLDIKCDFGK